MARRLSRLAEEHRVVAAEGVEVDQRLDALPRACPARLPSTEPVARRLSGDLGPVEKRTGSARIRWSGLPICLDARGTDPGTGRAIRRGGQGGTTGTGGHPFLRLAAIYAARTGCRCPSRFDPRPGKVCLDGRADSVCLEIAERDSEPPGCVSLKLRGGRIPAPLELRGWRAGDHYRPAGHSRDQKIKELFQERQSALLAAAVLADCFKWA